MKRLAAAGLALLLCAGQAGAAEDDWPVIKGERLSGQPPWAAFAIYRADGSVVGVTLFARPDRQLVARRLTMSGDRPSVSWAGGQACPALPEALAGLEQLPIPRLEVPFVGQEPRRGQVVMDGDSYFLWSDDARWGGGSQGSTLEMRAVGGSPLADWADRTLAAVAGCWGPAPPP